jgi:hypothetical protein
MPAACRPWCRTDEGGLLPHPDALTVNGKSIGDNCKGVENLDPKVICPSTSR